MEIRVACATEEVLIGEHIKPHGQEKAEGQGQTGDEHDPGGSNVCFGLPDRDLLNSASPWPMPSPQG